MKRFFLVTAAAALLLGLSSAFKTPPQTVTLTGEIVQAIECRGLVTCDGFFHPLTGLQHGYNVGDVVTLTGIVVSGEFCFEPAAIRAQRIQAAVCN